jgi:hypothetical protein
MTLTETDFEDLHPGDTLPFANALPIDWMREEAWEAVNIARAEADHPLAEGVDNATAHLVTFGQPGGGNAWAIVAVFSDGDFLPFDGEDGMIFWPIRCSPDPETLSVAVDFAEALEPDRDILQVTDICEEPCPQGIFTTVNEGIYRVADGQLTELLATCTCDPTSYGMKLDLDEDQRAITAYNSRFEGDSFPKTFVVEQTVLGGPADTFEYAYDGGRYSFSRMT